MLKTILKFVVILELILSFHNGASAKYQTITLTEKGFSWFLSIDYLAIWPISRRIIAGEVVCGIA